MKRTLIISVIMLSLAASGFAQTGDARAKGLAGAMTAVGDDMNALFYNPAGLAFLRKGYLNVEGNAALTANRSFDEPFSNALRDIYAVAGAGNVPTYYYTYAEGEDPLDEFVFGVDDLPYLAQLTALAQANGELVSGGKGTAQEKLAVMEECGFKVTRNPAEMGKLLKSVI